MKTIPITFAAILMTTPFSGAATHFSDLFDEGLAQWNVAGDVDVIQSQGNNFAALTTAHPGLEFGEDAVNLSGNAPLEAGGDLEDFIDAGPGDLDLDLFDQATEGSAIVLSTTVSLGDVLSFDWNLLSFDPGGLDYAFLMINGSIVETLSSSGSVHSSDAGFGNQTGFSAVTHTFTTEGPVVIAFGVVDIGDYAGTSTLWLDNVSIIPEPSALILGLLGMAPLLRRRRLA